MNKPTTTKLNSPLGYGYLLTYELIIDTKSDSPPASWQEPFTLLSYLAGVTQNLELATGVVVLPSRQTVLLAKQAAEVDMLSNGRLRLGVSVGWNQAEYQAMGLDFQNRGKRIEEQIELLRQLWSEPFVTFEGQYHNLENIGVYWRSRENPLCFSAPRSGLGDEFSSRMKGQNLLPICAQVGILAKLALEKPIELAEAQDVYAWVSHPQPIQRPIPIWIGGYTDTILQRVAQHGDGWLAHGLTPETAPASLDKLHHYIEKASRQPQDVGFDIVGVDITKPQDWGQLIADWQKLGATHLDVITREAGLKTPQQHLQAIQQFKTELGS